jgi:spermidine/putrescine transport system ATP-binding protein
VATGAPVEAFIRPEVAMLARTAAELPAGQAVHGGEVESLLFDGANSAVLLRETSTKFEFRIALPQTGRYADLRVGEQIHFSFDPERAVCFAAAGHG